MWLDYYQLFLGILINPACLISGIKCIECVCLLSGVPGLLSVLVRSGERERTYDELDQYVSF